MYGSIEELKHERLLVAQSKTGSSIALSIYIVIVIPSITCTIKILVSTNNGMHLTDDRFHVTCKVSIILMSMHKSSSGIKVFTPKMIRMNEL